MDKTGPASSLGIYAAPSPQVLSEPHGAWAPLLLLAHILAQGQEATTPERWKSTPTPSLACPGREAAATEADVGASYVWGLHPGGRGQASSGPV